MAEKPSILGSRLQPLWVHSDYASMDNETVRADFLQEVPVYLNLTVARYSVGAGLDQRKSILKHSSGFVSSTMREDDAVEPIRTRFAALVSVYVSTVTA